MNRYTTRQVTGLTGIARHTVYALIRAGVLRPERDSRAQFRFGFRDLVLLRTAQTLLSQSLAPRRLVSLLRALHRQLPVDTPLSALRILVDGDQILVRDRSTLWTPDSGQTVLDFALDEPDAAVASIDHAAVPTAGAAAMTADRWFEHGLELDERGQTSDAEHAYRETLRLQPHAANAMINLGRLLHARGELAQAEALYRQALAVEPHQFIALFNLGVVLEDRGAIDEAMQRYRSACAIDPGVAAIHYNLARLYRLQGDLPAADRHLARFHALRRATTE